MMKLQKHTETLDGRHIVAKATLRYAGSSPRKIRFVADAIRNKSVAEAFDVLNFAHRPSAVPHLLKALKAAVAAASSVHPEPQNLVVGEVIINDAPTMKRIRPASMGRAVRVRKRSAHIFLALTEM